MFLRGKVAQRRCCQLSKVNGRGALMNRREFGGLGLAALWAGRAWAGDWALVLAQAKGQEVPRDAFGHVKLSGIGEWLATEIEGRTGHEARTTVLGHIQRGGSPTAFDRVLATRFGLNAITAVKDQAWGTMVALQGTDIVRVPLEAATGVLKTVPLARYEEASSFFG